MAKAEKQNAAMAKISAAEREMFNGNVNGMASAAGYQPANGGGVSMAGNEKQ
jgi:hypothetical protein